MASNDVGYDYSSLLPVKAYERYQEKLRIIGMDCPYRLPADKWITDPATWPLITYWELQNYLLDHPSKLPCC